jgi:hypothetical protein
MRIECVPFAEEHLDAAAELLATRHRAHRAREPVLPDRFEDPLETRHLIAGLLRDGESGVVALRAGQPVGFMLGAPDVLPPTHRFSPFVRAQAASIRYVGHADGGEDPVRHALYAALAGRWRADGVTTHYVGVSDVD